jgi:hypothetical protein
MIDAYYSYNIQAGPGAKTNAVRVFDQLNNTFSVGMAKVAISLPAEPVGFRLDLAFGPTADISSSDFGLSTAGSPTGAPGSEIMKHLEQAYATVKLGPVTVDFGKFVTSAGAEVIESSGNWLQSRSMNFGYAIPFAHTGVRAAVAIGDVFTLQAGIMNGWDSVFTSLSFKTFNLSGALVLASGTSIYLNIYAGPQTTPDIRWLFDLVVNQNIGDKVALSLNGDFGMEGANSWYGASLMGKVQVVDFLRISARVEYFADPQGFRATVPGGGSFVTATLGAAFSLSGLVGVGNYEIRPEIRHDQQVSGTNAAYVGGTSTSQTTVSVAAVAWF